MLQIEAEPEQKRFILSLSFYWASCIFHFAISCRINVTSFV